MLIKKWSTKLAEKICYAAGETDEYRIDVVRYVFESLLSMILSVSFIVVTAWLFGVLRTAMMVSLAGALVKSFTGGLHSSTPLRCAVVGSLLTVGLSFLVIRFPISNLPLSLVMLILLFENLIVWLKAPLESTNKPLTEKQKYYLAFLSKIVVGIFSLICILWPEKWGVNELFYGMSFQLITLLSATARFMDRLDWFLGLIERKPIF